MRRFGGPSFTATPSGPNLTGAENSISADAPSLSRPIRTTYTYDVVDHLLTALVGIMPAGNAQFNGQQRSWIYDGLGRVTSATTPESGTVGNYYTDVNGISCAGDPSLVCRVIDARNITKTLSYDPINRIAGVTYSDGTPSVTYAYDAGGAPAFALDRMTSITEGANSQTFTYDNLGRITRVRNTIDSIPYDVQYVYNFLGQVSSITYPTNRQVNTSYDSIGRTTAVGDASTSYLTIDPLLGYNGAGQVTSVTFGNNVLGQFQYNDRLQISSLRYYKGSSELLNLGYDYGAANNGQIQAVHYYTSNVSPKPEDLTRSESFTYDAWGRLKQAQTLQVSASTPYTFKLQWGYDQLGNRLSQSLLDGNLPNGVGVPNTPIDTGTNRINDPAYPYDNAGNMTAAPGFTYAFDGANRMKQAQQTASPNTTTNSTFFGALRIKKTVGPPAGPPDTTTVYIYSGTKPIAEYVNGSLSKEYIYSGSTLLATIAGGAATYHHPDHLSNRVETDATGAPVRTFGHLPFGETWYEPTGTDELKFTSYERDSGAGETGLDYAMFRHYSSGLGGFMSADLLAGNPDAPQSLNRYAYAMNDPVNQVDPLGLFTLCLGFVHSDDGLHWYAREKPLMCWDMGDMGEGGGGGGGGGGPDCSLTIRVKNQNNLPADQLAAIENQIANLFRPASVGVNFVNDGGQKADAVLNLQDPGWWARDTPDWMGGDSQDYGHTVPGGGPSFVHSGKIKDAFRSRSLGVQSTIVGTIAAHELIHQLLQWADVPTPAGRDKSDIMSAGRHTSNGYSPDQSYYLVHDLFKLTSNEKARLLEDCLNRKKKP